MGPKGKGRAMLGGQHLLYIQLPESDGRKPEEDQSPEVREADWPGNYKAATPSKAFKDT